MENERQIKDEILSLYGIFQLDANKAGEYDMSQDDEVAEALRLLKQQHAQFVLKHMIKMPKGYASQDGGHPWFIFWNSQTLELMGLPNLRLNKEMKDSCVDYLRQCHNTKDGGFRGAPYLLTHVASTYAGMMAIVNLATEDAYNVVDIPAMKRYLLTVKNNFEDKGSNIFM